MPVVAAAEPSRRRSGDQRPAASSADLRAGAGRRDPHPHPRRRERGARSPSAAAGAGGRGFRAGRRGGAAGRWSGRAAPKPDRRPTARSRGPPTCRPQRRRSGQLRPRTVRRPPPALCTSPRPSEPCSDGMAGRRRPRRPATDARPTRDRPGRPTHRGASWPRRSRSYYALMPTGLDAGLAADDGLVPDEQGPRSRRVRGVLGSVQPRDRDQRLPVRRRDRAEATLTYYRKNGGVEVERTVSGLVNENGRLKINQSDSGQR